MSPPSASQATTLVHRWLLLEYLTMAWGVLSAVVATVAGISVRRVSFRERALLGGWANVKSW